MSEPKNQIIEGIRARHKSARPDATVNPAWANAEVDLNAMLCVYDSIAADLAQAQTRIASLERRYMDLGELAARYKEALREIASYEAASLEVENAFAASLCGKARVALGLTSETEGK